jgi:hypothetical protein
MAKIGIAAKGDSMMRQPGKCDGPAVAFMKRNQWWRVDEREDDAGKDHR